MTYTHHDFKNILVEIFKKYSSKPAITYLKDDGSQDIFTFSEIMNVISKLPNMFESYGIHEGDRVAVISSATPMVICAVYALALSDITAVMLDPSLPEEEVNRLLDFADVRGIFATEKIFQIIDEKTKRELPIFDIGSFSSNLVLFSTCPNIVKREESTEKSHDSIAMLFSSGTSSQMKGVLVSYNSMIKSREKQEYVFGIKPGDKYLIALPIYHISGYSSMIGFMLTGCQVAIIENVNATKLQNAFQKYNPNYFGMVPKVYDTIADKIRLEISKKGRGVAWLINLLLNLSGFTRRYFGLKIGRVICKPIYSKAFGKNIIGLAVMGSICKESTARLFLNMGINWANVYGSTECNAPTCSTGIHDRYAFDSVGKVTQFNDTNVVVNNPGRDNIGEVYIKTPMIMNGYFRDSEATSKAFDNGYFKTGDLGYIDERDYLHITGRSKEAIILHNGEKTSAQDVDNFYQLECPDVMVACCAVPNEDGTEDVHIFIETSDKPIKQIEKSIAAIKEKSLKGSSIYSLAGIHTIEKIPVTSIDKVKRYLLKEQIETHFSTDAATFPESFDIVSTEQIIMDIIAKHTKLVSKITPQSRISADLGLDSLAIFEIASEISTKLSIDIFDSLGSAKTIGELIDIASRNTVTASEFDVNEFPHNKTDQDIKALKKWIKIIRSLYHFEVIGQENIPQSSNFILCSNHINNLDPIWLLAAMGEVDYSKICCLAAIHLFQNKFTRGIFKMIGAIPVDRNGNTAPALNRCKECLIDGYSLIIFPEGARTRDGNMLPFKNGAAKLSAETGKLIVPARIDGGFEIFPREKSFLVFLISRKCPNLH